jgi:hypothetical protein
MLEVVRTMVHKLKLGKTVSHSYWKKIYQYIFLSKGVNLKNKSERKETLS